VWDFSAEVTAILYPSVWLRALGAGEPEVVMSGRTWKLYLLQCLIPEPTPQQKLSLQDQCPWLEELGRVRMESPNAGHSQYTFQCPAVLLSAQKNPVFKAYTSQTCSS